MSIFIHTYIHIEISYEGLTYMIIEAKSHAMLSINWKSGKASGIIQCKSKDLRTRGVII